MLSQVRIGVNGLRTFPKAVYSCPWQGLDKWSDGWIDERLVSTDLELEMRRKCDDDNNSNCEQKGEMILNVRQEAQVLWQPVATPADP